MLGLRGAVAPTAGLMETRCARSRRMLEEAGRGRRSRSASTSSSRRSCSRCSGRACAVVDAQQLMLDARQIKSSDEIMLLNQAAAMVDGVYQDIVEALKPGVRENEIVALANKRLYEMGSDQVEAVNAISGERCNPHPHNFTDRLIRPGDQAFFDIIHSFNGYRTCYYRTFAVGSATPSQRDAYTQAREWMDASIDGDQARRRHRRGRRGAGRRPTEFGFENEMAAFGLQFGHGLGLGPARAADHLAAQQHEGAGRAAGRHGLRAGDLLPGQRRLLRRADRGGGRGHRRRPAGPHPLPGPGALRRQPVLSPVLSLALG